MIIMINGAFGSGKSTIAKMLANGISNAMIFDPEEVGFFLRTILKEIDPQQDDFQHYSMWRSLVIETAQLLQETYHKDLIIPITIWRKPYFEEVSKGLKTLDANFHHFCLIAPENIIRERLHSRGEQPDSWAEQQAQHCIEAFDSPDFETKIDTTSSKPDEIAEIIMKKIHLAK